MTLSLTQSRAAKELINRRCETMRIFRSREDQEEFFRCTAKEVLARGGNRSGKSTISAVRFAAIATNRPVITESGERIDCRLPHQKGRKLRMWCIGYQENHIGQTLYRLLFKSGLIKIIRDAETQEWRAFRPWEESDLARIREVKLSPPLIPNRYIKPGSWAFKHRGNNVFTKVETWDPETKQDLAEIYAFSSTGEPKAGDPVDEIWIDEHIEYAKHYAEWQARLIDYDGRILWSSWPRTTNDALLKLTERAKECIDDEVPQVKEFVFTMSGNPYLPQKAKDEALAGWDDTQRKTRDRGEYETDELLLYPNFSRKLSSAITDRDVKEDFLSEILRSRGGEPPDDWTRELVLDPGTASPAVLFCAIPPEEYGDFRLAYDEIYIPRLTADGLAEKVLLKVQGRHFHRFIIDGNAARQSPMSFGITILQNYTDAFERLGIRSEQTGPGFTFGSNDIASRVMQLQSWMTIRADGTTKLRIVTKRCPFLVRQLETLFKKKDGDVITDKPASGQKHDLSDCLEYWASRSPQYVKPPEIKSTASPAYRYFMEKRQKRESGESHQPIHIGAGAA